MGVFKYLFNRLSEGDMYDKDDWAPLATMPEREFNALLGRDLVPTRLEDFHRTARTIVELTTGVDYELSESALILNNGRAADTGADTDIRNLIDGSQMPATAYIHAEYTSTLNKTDDWRELTDPMVLSIGIVGEMSNIGTVSKATLAEIVMDHRNKNRLEIRDINLEALELQAPETREEINATLKVIGGWIDTIEAGNVIIPAKCKKELIEKAKLREDKLPFSKYTARHAREIWQKMSPTATAIRAAKRTKQIYQALRRH